MMKTDPVAPAPQPKPKPASTGKVFDVRRPGRAPANATSKPVIVGHKPIVKDPDVTVKADDSRQLMDSHQKIDIKPNDTSLEASAPHVAGNATSMQATQSEVTDKVAIEVGNADQPAAKPAAKAPDLAKEQVPEAIAQVAIGTTEAEVVKNEDTPASSTDIPDDFFAQHPVDQEDIIVSQHHSDNPWKVAILVVIVILLAVIAFDILLDAGLVTVSGIPHTNFLR